MSHMVPVHLSNEESKFLDIIQGYTSWNEQLGIRQYPGITKVLKQPSVQKIIQSVKQDYYADKKLDGKNEVAFKAAKNISHAVPDRSPYRAAPTFEKLARLGRGGDTKMAMMPVDAVNILNKTMVDGGSINPKTGQPEYFLFLLPLLGAVAGSVVASAAGWGTLATMAAVGVGTAFGSKAAGASWKQAGINGLLAAGTAGALSWMSAGAGASGVGAGAAGSAGSASAGAAGGIEGAVAGLEGAGAGASQVAPGFGAKMLSALEGTGKILTSPAVTVPTSIALMAKSHQTQKENEKRYAQEMQDAMAQHQRINTHHVPRYRINEYGDLNKPASMEDFLGGRERRHVRPFEYERYAAGGAVRGPHKGQADNINADLREGDYIQNASDISDFGDGNTEAGYREMDKFFKPLARRSLFRGGRTSRGRIIKAKISTGEYRIPAAAVTNLGRGNNARGANMIDHMNHNMRMHKRTSGRGLPPKALSPLQYMRGGHA